MRRSELLALTLSALALTWTAARAEAPVRIPGTASAAAPAAASGAPRTQPASASGKAPIAFASTDGSSPAAPVVAPTCIDLEVPGDGFKSTGRTKVPVTLDAETGYRDMEAVKQINRDFKLEQVEKLVFDATLDLPSQARLLMEYRCFGNWKRQHDLYRKVIREHRCAYLRHRAVQLLEYDMCSEATVTVLIAEFNKSIFQQTRELIIRKLGMSKDQRAIRIVDETTRSKSQLLSKAAKEGKASGSAQPCMDQQPTDKPYYGYLDVADTCEGVPDDGSGLVGNGGGNSGGNAGAKPADGKTAAQQPAGGASAASGAPDPRDGGVSDVHFGN